MMNLSEVPPLFHQVGELSLSVYLGQPLVEVVMVWAGPLNRGCGKKTCGSGWS